jgi:hypothetical protein
VVVGVEDDVELALLDPLVEPGAAEDQPPDPMDQAAVRRADELGPVLVDVLPERRGRLPDLAVAKSCSLKEKRSSPYSRT